MHLIVRKELSRQLNDKKILGFEEEKKVLLGKKIGYYDFFVLMNNKTIGFEVLSRPSKKKLLTKLAYAEKTDDKEDVYKAVGPIMVKSSKKDMQNDLGERKETVDLRLKTVQKQSEKIKEKVKEVQDKLRSFLEPTAPAKAE